MHLHSLFTRSKRTEIRGVIRDSDRVCHDRYCATVYGLHLAGLGWRWRPLCYGKVDNSLLSSDSSTSGLQTSRLESHLAQATQAGPALTPKFLGDEHRPCLMPPKSVSAFLPVPQAGHKASQTQYQHQQDLEHGKRPSSSEGQG